MSDHHHQTGCELCAVTELTVKLIIMLYIITPDNVQIKQYDMKAAGREVDYSE